QAGAGGDVAVGEAGGLAQATGGRRVLGHVRPDVLGLDAQSPRDAQNRGGVRATSVAALQVADGRRRDPRTAGKLNLGERGTSTGGPDGGSGCAHGPCSLTLF